MTEWTPSTMGKKGGASRSPAKVEAVRENGRKYGGRPKAEYDICPKCSRRISLLKAGGFRKHNCTEESNGRME